MQLKLIYTKPKKHPFPVISWLIRLATWSDCSHVILVFVEDDLCFHIYFNDWVMQELNDVKENHTIVHEQTLVVPSSVYDSVFEECKKDNGTKTKGYYGYLIGSMIGKILNIKNPAMVINDWNATTCSESLYLRLVYRLKVINLYKMLINELPFKKVTNVSPKDLKEVFKDVAFENLGVRIK